LYWRAIKVTDRQPQDTTAAAASAPLGAPPVAAATRARLTPARITELALGIIDREGLEGLNMRRLADEAGVKPMTLYHHFRNKEAMLTAVAETIAAGALGEAQPAGEWRDRVRALFVGLHRLVEAHPRALPLITTGVLKTPSGRRWMEELMRVLLDAGFAPESAATVYHVLGAYTLGLGYAGLLSLDVTPASIAAEAGLSWLAYPSMLRVGLRLARWDDPGEFATGLEVLLEHFAATLTPEGGAP
jgi:TetR/AcrR family tetracycline transcriptional repressor